MCFNFNILLLIKKNFVNIYIFNSNENKIFQCY